MDSFCDFICKHKKIVLVISFLLLILSFIGMKLTKVNYDILVYLPEDIETIKGQNILTDDFDMGSYSIAVTENMSSKEILKLEEEIKKIEGVNQVASLYDVLGTSIPIEMLPNEIVTKVHQDNTDLLFITFDSSTSSEETLNAVQEIRNIGANIKQGGMSSMVLDTMNLSEKEIFVYVIIAVILCIIILELSLDSYVVPFLLLANIGFAICFNLGSNIFLGQISYITKALVAVLQLGVTTDFSIFLYHSYEKKKRELNNREQAMKEAIKDTFTSVTGSSLTTIAGFLVLCTMNLTLGRDLGIVMAKGVLLGVVCVLTLFPSLLLVFDNLLEKTKHHPLTLKFNKLNNFIIKHKIAIFTLFIILLIPIYLAYSKVDVYYKLDKSLPSTLESIETNEILKEKYNIISPEIILLSSDIKDNDVVAITKELENTEGIEWALSLVKLKQMGIDEEIIPNDFLQLIQNENYQLLLINSSYETATKELNRQIDKINNIVKSYDDRAIVAGEGPLMKDLVNICDIDFNNVNTSSIVCIFIILFLVLKSLSLPFLLIITIEFAIFMNMSFSYFGGVVLPFIAPIVLGTIQLGATIDYAILLTTTYLKRRKKNIPKEKTMLETLNYTENSILTSAMCFFAATFGVGVYSKIEMIGTLCSLLARGAIVSMLVVIMVLPSILLIFDRLIMKTTINRKKENNVKKNIKKGIEKEIKKVVVTMMIIGLALNPISIFALTKNETVYAKLDEKGNSKKVLVTEQIINPSKLDNLEDYTELKDILNVNNNNSYTRTNDKLVWNASGQDIYYQGTINKEIPVTVDISYKLNGEKTTVDDMLGKSGKVTINLKYKNNDKRVVNINGKKEVLYTPFMVTVGTILDSEVNTNVKVSNGKVVSNGTNNIIVAVATPGLYESLKLDELKNMDTITISYETTKFELSSIYSVITPKLIESSDLDIFNKMDSLYKKVDQLQTNMDKIEKASKQLASGSKKLKEGLSSAMGGLSSGGSALSTSQVSSIADSAWQQVQAGLSSDNPQIKKYVEESVTNIMKAYLGEDNFLIYASCLLSEDMVCSSLTTLDMSTAYQFQKKVEEQVISTISQTSSYVAENTARQVAVSVSETVANQVKSVATSSIASSLTTLYNGVDELDKGISALTSGISSFNKVGIKYLSNMVNNKIKPITSRIESLVKLSNNYKSFATTNKLTNGETKFVLVIDGKKVPEVTKKITTDTQTTTFWDRLKKLFS